MTVARLTQGIVEALNQADPKARVTQAAVEILSWTLEAPVLETQPLIFVCT